MTDNLAPERRSHAMRAVKARNTSPELIVRAMLCEIGARGYRLHRKELPGKPDITFIGRRKAIFVHGCFWHGHNCPRGNRKPKTNSAYWAEKIARNRARDSEHFAALSGDGWKCLVLWECELREPEGLRLRLTRFVKTEQ